MKIWLDKLMTHVAYFYIITPFLLFCYGWLRWYYALGMTIVLVVSYLLSIKSTKEFIKTDVRKHTGKIIAALAIIIIIVFFSGIGEYSYQVEDHQFRNSMLHDLVTHKWPFRLNERGDNAYLGRPVLYIYYIEYWFPAALVGKLLGWKAANFFLYLWTVIGVTITFYFLCRYFKRFSLRVLFIFFFFNGLYLIVSFFKFPVVSVITSDYQLWSGDMLLAGSSIDSLFWIYNQIITPWIIIIFILNNLPKQNIFFLYALCYLHGPFTFIGFFPFLAIILIKDLFAKQIIPQPFIQRILPYLSFQNLVAAPLILLVGYLFLSGSTSVQTLFFEHVRLIKYAAFISVSFGIIALLLFNKYKKEPLFYATVIMLSVLPLVGMGNIQPFTFCARVSLAPQFILMLLTAKFVLEEGNILLKKLVVTYLILGTIEPALELGRSVVFTVGYYVDPVCMNTYLYHRTSLFNSRINMLPKTNDFKNSNFLILNYIETLDTSINPNMPYFKVQKDTTLFSRFLMK